MNSTNFQAEIFKKLFATSHHIAPHVSRFSEQYSHCQREVSRRCARSKLAVCKKQTIIYSSFGIEVANILNGTYIQIEGNTAKVEGNDGVEFSKKRALSVAKFLNRLGVSSDRFIIVGNGDKKPIADNSTEEGRQQNRRTEVFFKVEGY